MEDSLHTQNALRQTPAQEVSFVVKNNKNNKKDADGKRHELYLVNKVSGWFDPGEMAALVSKPKPAPKFVRGSARIFMP